MMSSKIPIDLLRDNCYCHKLHKLSTLIIFYVTSKLYEHELKAYKLISAKENAL